MGDKRLASGLAPDRAPGLHHADWCRGLDLRAFASVDEPAQEPCTACGLWPSHFRELRATGEPRHLCRACHGAAVRRERRAGPPLSAVIDPDGLRRVAASVGRCDVCGLEAAAFSGSGVRLCGPCFDREARRQGRAGVQER